MKEKLLQPFQLGTLTLLKRMVMTTVTFVYGTIKAEVTERHKAFYVGHARGSVGLITSEPLYIHPSRREIPTQLGIYRDILIPGLKRLDDAVHEANGRITAHNSHADRATNPKLEPVKKVSPTLTLGT
jgi:2,4-dienoyl-CoA reductase-like NADH-dependent reductase (Old Yellow Enzyme family)